MIESRKLNLGCGTKYREGWFNVDFARTVKADVYHNLDVFPWPLPSDRFEHVEFDNVLEHLRETIAVLEELHRIMAPGGVAIVRVPYAFSTAAFQDPSHVRFFTEKSLDYLSGRESNSFYTKARFEVSAKLLLIPSTFAGRMRRLIPFRNVLRWFIMNMYDTVEYRLVKMPTG